MDKCRIKGHAIDVQSDRGELDTEGEVVPLAVTHLRETERGSVMGQSMQYINQLTDS